MQISLTRSGPKRWSKLAKFTICSRTRAPAKFRMMFFGKCLLCHLIDTKVSAASSSLKFQRKSDHLDRCGINEHVAPFTSEQTRDPATNFGISETNASITRTTAHSSKTSSQPMTTSRKQSGTNDVVAVRNGISRQYQRLSKNHQLSNNRNVRNRWTN